MADTSRGVFRFDGVRFQSVDEATNGVASNLDLDSVFVAPSGTSGLLRVRRMLLWKNGTLTTYPIEGARLRCKRMAWLKIKMGHSGFKRVPGWRTCMEQPAT